MTLRRRMTLAFAVILGLFALNLLIYLVSDYQRHASLDRLEAAVERQLLVVSIRQQIDDRALEVQLLSTVLAAGGEGLSAEERGLLEAKLADLDEDVEQLMRITPGERRRAVELLHDGVARLRRGWLNAYRGASFASTLEPQRRVLDQLTGLWGEERRSVDEATAAFFDLAHLTSRLTVSCFLLSTLVAVVVAVRFSRHLNERLRLLREGAARVGRGELEKPIPVDTRDELGQLAGSLNEMAKRLAALRQTESLLRQEEKMASLGKVAAGLAHELNNPAAALARNVAALEGQLAHLERLAGELGSRGVAAESLAAFAEFRRELADESIHGELIDPLTRSDRETELEELLDAHGVAEPWELAPDLVRAGVEAERLAALVAALPEGERPPVLAWWARTQAAESLLAESALAATRLSEIVGAVGRYSHLGEAPVGDVDLGSGLEDTLTVLRTRLSGIRLETDLARDLPPVEGHAGELNQVWTILIDNALDAMGGDGTLRLATRRCGDDRVAVEVCDDGPGIAEENRRSIFDPFFTTKQVGSGTGLGLHIAHQIVGQHDGEIEVESEVGEGTCFRVLLPVRT